MNYEVALERLKRYNQPAYHKISNKHILCLIKEKNEVYLIEKVRVYNKDTNVYTFKVGNKIPYRLIPYKYKTLIWSKNRS